MEIHYMLIDDGGINDLWEIPILLPIGTFFEHEFGTYKVSSYDKMNDGTTAVMCDRQSTVTLNYLENF